MPTRREQRLEKQRLASPVSHFFFDQVMTAVVAPLQERVRMHENILLYLTEKGVFSMDEYLTWDEQKTAEVNGANQGVSVPEQPPE